MIKKFLIITIFICIASVIRAQEPVKFMAESGVGYFGYLGFLSHKNNGLNNPRMEGIYSSTATFIDFSYLLKSHYWLGIKYIKADVELPYNDDGFFWEWKDY